MTDSENQNRSFFMFVLLKSTLTSECAKIKNPENHKIFGVLITFESYSAEKEVSEPI